MLGSNSQHFCSNKINACQLKSAQNAWACRACRHNHMVCTYFNFTTVNKSEKIDIRFHENSFDTAEFTKNNRYYNKII